MSYGVVCTNYNNTHYTVSLIESLVAGELPPRAIVVVDNASTPIEADKLKSLQDRHKTVEVIYNAENLGYFPGLNVGIRYLHALHPDLHYMLVGNNDLTFPANFGVRLAERLADFARHPVVIPDIVTVDGLHQNPMMPEPPSRLREFIYDLYFSSFTLARIILGALHLAGATSSQRDAPGHTTPRPVYSGIGALYVLTQTFFANYDELWAPTFLMGEEFFLQQQLKERGFQTYYDPALSIQHFFNGSVRQVPRKQLWKFAARSHWLRRQYAKGSGLELLHARIPHAPIPFHQE